jgi:acyl dehydratase
MPTKARMADRELVGVCIDEVEFPVEEGKIREFAAAVGDPNPIYRDREAARAVGHPSIPAPPTFSIVAAHWRDQAAMVRRLGLDLRRIVVGEAQWDYLVPIYAGDWLSGARIVKDVSERTGRRGGRMTMLTIETELRNQRGEVAVRQRDLVIELGPEG